MYLALNFDQVNQKRFFITDIDNPGATNIGQSSVAVAYDKPGW